jgi:cytochrome c peroxidase
MTHSTCTWILAAAMIVGCGPQSEPVSREHQVRHAAPKLENKTLAPASQKVMLGSPALLSGIPGEGPLTVEEIQVWLMEPANHAPLNLEFPMWMKPGAGQVKDLKDAPMTRAKIELGRQLFFDKRLSADNTVSCASCHEPEKGYTVATPFATGIGGQQGKRNPPTLLNRMVLALGNDQQFWDGRSLSVEDALLHALEDPTEMAATPQETVRKLKELKSYRLQFERIYKEVSWDALGDAIGCFVRCLVTDSAPYDHYARWEVYKDLGPDLLAEDPELAARYREAKAAADAHPLSESAKRGEYLFFGNKAFCSSCHNGVNFTDELFHNIGVGLQPKDPDLGRYHITGKDEDWGAFKTPSIRAAVWTAPYMHDGSLATLEDVIEWYAHEGLTNRNLDYRYRRISGDELTAQDKKDLVEFVKACSGPLPKVETGRLPE